MKFFVNVSPNGLRLTSPTGDVLEELPIVPAKPEHRAYILSTWVRSYESMARRLLVAGMRFPTEEYRNGESRLAEAHWDKAKVVVSSADEFTIHAWVCAEPGRLFHVYVPPALRRSGVARALVESTAGKDYVVHKPWPSIPRGHSVAWSPYV